MAQETITVFKYKQNNFLIILFINTYGQSSSSKERILDKCVPKFLCTPEHSIQTRPPIFRDAQSGSENINKNF